MKRKNRNFLRRREREIKKRLARDNFPDHDGPVMNVPNIHFEMAERTRAIGCGGIGAIHTLCDNAGLATTINRKVNVFKRHVPYFESDHVLNIAYNTFTGGRCLEDIENHRNDTSYLEAVGAQRIPDPTTAGDFTRRFGRSDVIDLMDAINETRQLVWDRTIPMRDRQTAVIDVDGILAETTGECKEGMDIAYNGIWGYHPLVVSLANTAEPLYLVNRSGNRPSHDGAAPWIDRAAELTSRFFTRSIVRGDTDFSLTANFDRWTDSELGFVFGYDAKPNLVKIADRLTKAQWDKLKRRQKNPSQGQSRAKPEKVKEKIVEERGFRNLVLEKEHVAEFPYSPAKCKRTYRMVVVRKTIQVKEGQKHLFDEERYFFYITNLTEPTPAEVVFLNNDRCDQENLLGELSNGLNAMRMPAGDLNSNWAYMVMAAMAWTLKAWFALHVWIREDRSKLIRMGFRQFLNTVVRIPCQIVRGARKVTYRILGYTKWTRTFLSTFGRLRKMSYG
ncbi:MAG: IS1380 family transposase [Planctomycetota bacterium]